MIVLLAALQSTLSMLPSECALASYDGVGEWVLKNDCTYPVYWSFECYPDQKNCAGGKMAVSAGSSRTLNSKGTGPWIVNGPFKS